MIVLKARQVQKRSLHKNKVSNLQPEKTKKMMELNSKFQKHGIYTVLF